MPDRKSHSGATAYKCDPLKFAKAVAGHHHATDVERVASGRASAAMKPKRSLPALALLGAMSCAAAAAAGPVKSQEEAVRLVIAAVHRFKLTTLRDGCWLMDVTEKPAYFDLDIREVHTPGCGGEPAVEPRLFTVRVNKRHGSMTSDVYDGVYYRPLNHKPQAR